jgi:hypothetical protein
MRDHAAQRAREEKVCSREYMPTRERVEAAFLYQLGLSYREVGE